MFCPDCYFNLCGYPSRMSLIAVAILFTCCFFAAASGLNKVTCGKGALCVNVEQCLQYWQPLERLRQTNHTQFITFLSSATCDFDSRRPKICCPIQPLRPEKVKPPVSKPINCGTYVSNRNLDWTRDGMPTELNEFPWLALLEYETGYGRRFACGGVLISDRHVLTAAQCLNPYGNKLVSVRLGEHDLRTSRDCVDDPESLWCNAEAIDVGIERQIPHESYSELRGASVSDFDNFKYDIAVLKLKRSVITDVIKPICLPEPLSWGSKNLGWNGFLSAGWGLAPDVVYPISSVKVKSNLKPVNWTDCDFIYDHHILHNDNICAFAKTPKATCITDLGGPLMGFTRQAKMSVVGIYSPVNRQSCRIRGVPSTFIDVREHLHWIQRQMQY